MEDLGACYLCARYKATVKTDSGVAICPVCVQDLHEDAANGEESVKEKIVYKGSTVKASINGHEIKPFSRLNYKFSPDKLAINGMELKPLSRLNYKFSPDNECCGDEFCNDQGCQCDDSCWDNTPSALSWQPTDSSEAMRVMLEMAKQLEKDLWNPISPLTLNDYCNWFYNDFKS